METYAVSECYTSIGREYPHVLEQFKERFPDPAAQITWAEFLNTLDDVITKAITPIRPSLHARTTPCCAEDGEFRFS